MSARQVLPGARTGREGGRGGGGGNWGLRGLRSPLRVGDTLVQGTRRHRGWYQGPGKLGAHALGSPQPRVLLGFRWASAREGGARRDARWGFPPGAAFSPCGPRRCGVKSGQGCARRITDRHPTVPGHRADGRPPAGRVHRQDRHLLRRKRRQFRRERGLRAPQVQLQTVSGGEPRRGAAARGCPVRGPLARAGHPRPRCPRGCLCHFVPRGWFV